MADAQRDQNYVTTLLAVSSVDGVTPVPVYANPITHRLLVDLPSGSGSVTDVSVVSANGFAGTVATSTTTPAITLSTTITGLLVGNGTSIAAAVSGTDIKTVNGTSLLGAGNVSVTAAPGGSDTQVQYNNAGALAGITGATSNGTTLTLVAPVLGTPASATLTNATGLPISTGVSGLGTGIAAALAVNTGSAGAPVLLNGALGTPSSGTVTNLTGTASININGTVGATTPTTGVFTTLVANATTSLLLGTAGSAVGNIGFRNATSGTITLAPTTGALGTVTLTLPAITDTLVTLTASQTLTNKTLTSPVIATLASNTLTLGTGTFTTLTFDAGASDPVITASSGVLTVSTGDFRVTTAGTNAASAVTVGGTQTLTNKTLTTPVISSISNTGTLTLPTSTDTLVGRATTDTLTNKTLTSPTINTATIGGATPLAENASIDLDPSLSADGTYSGICITGTAGTTLAFGDLIYLAVADSRWELVDADSVTTCGAVLTGMCVLAAAADGNATKILLKGNIRADAAFPALTVGANVYAGLTPGDIVTTAPSATDDVVHVVGKALTADSIYFDPSEDYITIV